MSIARAIECARVDARLVDCNTAGVAPCWHECMMCAHANNICVRAGARPLLALASPQSESRHARSRADRGTAATSDENRKSSTIMRRSQTRVQTVSCDH